MSSFFLALLRALALVFAVFSGKARGQSLTTSVTAIAGFTSTPSSATLLSSPTSTSPYTTTSFTRVVQVFFIDERSYEGLPYTMLHRDQGRVLAVSANLTTLVITSTRVDQRPLPTHSRTDNVTTGIVTLASTRQLGVVSTTTGSPSTITQGPATFLFTGTRYGPDHTLINRCSLNGTASAVCNITHVGSAWYTRNTAWNGAFSTYSYTWTSGGRFGFAPVTITAGAEMLALEGEPTASGSSNAAAASFPPAGGGRGGALIALVVASAAALGVGIIL